MSQIKVDTEFELTRVLVSMVLAEALPIWTRRDLLSLPLKTPHPNLFHRKLTKDHGPRRHKAGGGK